MTPRPVSWKLNLAMLWFSQLLILAGFQALIPFIPLFIKNELGVIDHNELAVAVVAFNFLGTAAYAIFNPIWGLLSDRFGVKPMLLRGTFVTSIFFILMAYSKTVTMLVFLRFISAGCAGTTAASQAMVARNTPDEHQGFALGVLTTAIWGGSVLGYVAGGLLIHYFNYTVAFWVCGIFYILGGISILFTRDAPIPEKTAKKHSHVTRASFLPGFTRAVWIMLFLFLILGLIRTFEVPYIALKVEELTGKDTAAYWTGITSAAVCAAAIVSGIFSGYLVDRLPVAKLMLPIMLISAAALWMQGVAGSLWFFAVSRILLYTAAGGLQPVLQKVLSSVTPPRKRGSVFGFASSAQSIGTMLAAVLSGAVMSALSISGVFCIAGLLFVIALPVILRGIFLATRPFVFHHPKA